MYINEDLLFEATFTNPANLQRHYEKHVLKPVGLFLANMVSILSNMRSSKK